MLIDLGPLRRHRDFRLLYIGQSVSFLGSMLTYVAIPYQLYGLTKSSLLVGLLGTVQLLPLLATALWGGALADALDRRKLIIRSELGLAAAAAALAANSLLPEPSVALIFVVAGLMSALNGFHRPAMDALMPRLVERSELASAAALGSLRHSVGSIAGPALGGACIAAFGLPATYVIDAASFAVSIAALASMRRMPPPEEAPAAGLGSIVEGLRYAAGRPELIGTYVVDIVAMTFAMPMALFPAMAERFAGAGPGAGADPAASASAAGWLYAAMSIGSLAITLVSGWARHVRRHGAAVVWAAAAWGVAIVALAFAPSLAWAVACLALAGAADMVSGLFRSTIWNETIPSRLRGRLAGVEMISYMSGPLLGNARAGWMASAWSPFASVFWGGALCVAGVLLCIPLLPGFWRYRREK